MTERIVIVGAGQAGARAAAELRRLGYAGAIALIGDEPGMPYERPPLSKAVLLGTAMPADASVNPEGFYAANAIEHRAAIRVAHVDPVRRAVELTGGERLSYDRLILATGVRPRAFVDNGVELAGVHRLRTAEDALGLKDAMAEARAVVVVGGGFVGLEVAAAARTLGRDVTVIEAAPACLARVLPAAAVEPIIALHRERGVDVRCGARVEAFESESGRVRAVRLTCGTRLVADVIIVGIGSVPQSELARAAGLDEEDGVLVDRDWRTSDSAIFAIGDVARPRDGRRHESWHNAERGAAHAATVILGAPVPPPSPPWFWTDQFDWNVQMLGEVRADDSVEIEPGGGPDRYVQVYTRAGAAVGAVMVNMGRARRRLAAMLADTAVAPLAA